MKPIRMNPVYRFGDMTPWGGNGLRTCFGRDIPDKRTGESLEISTIPGLESRTDSGITLSELLKSHTEEIMGQETGRPFPLLLKLLASKEMLSVQVHPDNAYASKHENKLGKTEAWVILHAEEGAFIYYGFHVGVTKEDIQSALQNGNAIESLLEKHYVKPGEVYYMPSGMVHAIGGGIVLYEIQQSSDVTYRLWDYNRTNVKGEKRPLHIQQSLDVIVPELRGQITRVPEYSENRETVLLDVPAFCLSSIQVSDRYSIKPDNSHFQILTALQEFTYCCENEIRLLRGGDSMLIPAFSSEIVLKGHGQVLLVHP